jgi:hypothetical protein
LESPSDERKSPDFENPGARHAKRAICVCPSTDMLGICPVVVCFGKRRGQACGVQVEMPMTTQGLAKPHSHFDFASDVHFKCFPVLRVTSLVQYRLTLVVEARIRPFSGVHDLDLKHLGTLLVGSYLLRCRTSAHLATIRQKQTRHHVVPSSTRYSHPPP